VDRGVHGVHFHYKYGSGPPKFMGNISCLVISVLVHSRDGLLIMKTLGLLFAVAGLANAQQQSAYGQCESAEYRTSRR
jgi:hypothetical protein